MGVPMNCSGFGWHLFLVPVLLRVPHGADGRRHSLLSPAALLPPGEAGAELAQAPLQGVLHLTPLRPRPVLVVSEAGMGVDGGAFLWLRGWLAPR